MVKKNDTHDSSYDKKTAATPVKSSSTKPQENYPGPSETGKEPQFVKDWKAEPPRTIDSSDKSNANSDLAIQHRIVEKLKKEIDGFEKIEIQVSGGVVTLAGTVRYEAVKSNVALLTRNCDGVVQIHNHLTVEE